MRNSNYQLLNSHFPIYKYQTSQASSSLLPRGLTDNARGLLALALFQIVDLDHFVDVSLTFFFLPMHTYYPRLTGTVLGIGSFPVVPCRQDKRDEHLFGQMTTTLQFFYSLLFFLAPSFLQSAGSSSDGKHWVSFKCSPRVDADNSSPLPPSRSPCLPIHRAHIAAVPGT